MQPVENVDPGTPDTEVRSVSHERWQEAQTWERELWETSQHKHGWRRVAWTVLRPVLRAVGWKRAWGDDWNYWWAERFDGYSFLPRELGDCIELGCGPYTNTRVILRDRTAARVVCSDPLAETYITFRERWLAKAAREGLVEVDAHPIEELPFERESFDVVVMINVLDHVRDADLCLAVATGLVRPGGIFIIGQDLSNEDDVRGHPYDVGHPIRLTQETVEGHLAGFEPVLRKDLSRDEGREPRLHYGTLIFAGRKRAGTPA
jgi:SAM-dependent methyltransferase